jgi:hypothetical protein
VIPIESPVAIALGATVLVLVVGAIIWWVRSRAKAREHEALPLYSIGLGRPGEALPARPRPAVRPSPDTVRATGAPVVGADVVEFAEAGVAPDAGMPPVARSVVTPVHGATALGASETGRQPGRDTVNGAASPGSMRSRESSVSTKPRGVPLVQPVPEPDFGGQVVRYQVPQDGTLQFLPGRLEVIGGVDTGRDVRFVHLPGPEGDVITFGRSEGPPYRHIQLREATVSRNHARLRFEQGAWHLTNLSATNPVVLNDHTLGVGEEHRLTDGDRVEMGEVVFAFRGR